MSEWYKSSYSGTSSNCVEVANPWHKSNYSQGEAACVEISEGPITGIRDTKNRDLGALFFSADEWHAFLSLA